MLFYFSLGILIFILGASLFPTGRFFNNRRFPQFAFYFSLVAVFLLLSYQSYQQFQVWSQNEVSKFLLPPHQSIAYFIFYTGVRFFAPYLISFAAAILFLFSAKKLNKKYDERFFEPEEPYFGALAIFLVGYPGWLFYVIFFIFCYFIIQFIHICVNSSANQRISAYWLWLPVAIFVIIIQDWLAKLPLWSLLKL